MRVAVSESGYAGAVVELVAANQYAAYLAEAHADRLRGTAAMAGDDSTAEEFAASYDTAAAQSLAALASLVDAFAALGRLVEASLANHATADTRACSILDSLRLLTAGTALRARPVAVTVNEVGASASRISRARVMLMEAGGRGAKGSTSGAARFPTGSLVRHENQVAHTLKEHVGRTASEMRQRLLDKPGLGATSTFRTSRDAEMAIEEILRRNLRSVEQWLERGRGKHVLSEDLGREVGEILLRDSTEATVSTRARVVLIPDETMPEGWRLLTAYPIR